MYYYEHHIGDYRRDTGHLTLLEHGIYRQLLDTIYITESPLTSDLSELMRSHCVRMADEQKALENVLKDFFELTDSGYTHGRCERVINTFKAKSESAKASAKARWANKSDNKQDVNANGMRTVCETDAFGMLTNNHKPITNNHKPSKDQSETPTSKPKSKKTSLPADFAVSESVKSWAFEKGHANLDAHLESFKLKAAAAGYQYVNWDSAFMGAIRDNWAKVPAVTTAKAVDSWQGREF
jgi:uncharacterized protein YdaU (DUF1376 family)